LFAPSVVFSGGKLDIRCPMVFLVNSYNKFDSHVNRPYSGLKALLVRTESGDIFLGFLASRGILPRNDVP
jgi:hypothetical protein